VSVSPTDNVLGRTAAWFRDLSVEIIGGLVVAIVVIVVPTIWWALMR
jgi:hypothetical protein